MASAATTLLIGVLSMVLLLPSHARTGVHDEDFAFDVAEDIEVELTKEPPPVLSNWDDLDSTAEIGRIFHLAIPKQAFGDGIRSFEVKVHGNKPFPSWLLFEKHNGLFRGVPTQSDEGQLSLHIRALKESGLTSPFAKTIKLRIVPPHEQIKRENCPSSEDSTVLALLIDRSLDNIKPKQRVVAIDNLARFFGLQSSAFTLEPLEKQDDITDSSVVLAGPGNIKRRNSKKTTVLYLTIGCDGKLWMHTGLLVHQLKEQAKDGTISEVLRLPLIGWRVRTETRPLVRDRRDTAGSGDSGDYDDDYYYDEYDDEYDDEDGESNTDDDKEKNVVVIASTPKPTTNKKTPKPTTTTTATTTTTTTVASTPKHTTLPSTSETHPHRHHHGEKSKTAIDVAPSEEIFIKETETVSHHTVPTTSTSTTTQYTTPSVPLYTEAEAKQTYPAAVVEDYEDEDVDAEIDEDDAESETILPPVLTHTETEVPVTPKSSTTWEAIEVISEKETIPSTLPSSSSPVPNSPSTSTTITSSATTSTTTTTTTTTEMPSTAQDTTLDETLPTTVQTSTTTTTTEQPTILLTEPSYPSSPKATTEEETSSSTSTAANNTTTTSGADVALSTMPATVTSTTSSTTLRSTAAHRTTTERIEYDMKNFPPSIQNRLKRIAVTAGKVFSYFIPEDTFTDLEDGTNLRLRFFSSEGASVAKNSWCQFNPRTREIYGLPLEEDVSRWEYILEATDSEGASVSDRLEILVQHHKARRVVNHEFSLHIRVENKAEFPNTIDWQLRTLRGLGSLYQISNLSDITVRHVNYTADPVIFTWTNDSLPKSYCPTSDIDYLYSVLTANEEGDPSIGLSQSLAPDLRVKKVVKHGIGLCDKPQPQPPIATPTNFSPIPRNQVDHINATVGELLIFRVPDDTFYDPEDGDARNLKMSLLTIDRSPLPTDHWLQFDSKNQEFFGTPMSNDSGHREYQLVCEDRGGLTANDVLVVVVHPAPRRRYNVDITMTIETPYDSFVKSASIKRKFVEKLRDLFKDRDSNNIHINSISEGSTIVSWSNKSLAQDVCPDAEIKKFRQVLVNDDETIADRVETVMGPEFPVAAIALKLTGKCHGEFPVVHPPDVISTVDEPAATDSSSDEYLITFVVPAVIIGAMLLLAGVVACVLYRRRRTGKMNVEDDERQSFRNKGIPVIFQDELEEKPDPATKTPVILKEEKPPLAPPEYSKSGTPVQAADDSDAKYQPPPPFPSSRENGRQARPKPTPTYRKPPPYVPP